MTQVLIVTDNNYSDVDNVFLRGTGAHKIATSLRDRGWQVEVIDYILRWSLSDFKQICDRLIDHRTIMLGVSSNLFTDRDSFNEKLHWFKSTYPQVQIVLGGNHLLARDIEPVDYLIEGYAESALHTLLEYLSGAVSLQQVKFSAFTDKVRLIDATKDYPFNDTHDLTIRYHDSDFIQPHETLAIETGRGCIFKCKFCTYPLIGKKKNDFLRHHLNLRDELLRNYETYGIKNYIIAEDTFNDSEEKLQNLADAINGLPFQPQFAGFMRFDLIWSRPHTLLLLKQIGVRSAFFGIETFDDRDGRLVRKGMASERVKDGLLWWVQEAPEIATHVGMIFGLPNCNEETAWKDNEWLSQSGLNWWSWSALWFTDTTKTIHTSDFSHNFREYGYKLMSDDEVHEWLENQSPTQNNSNNFFSYNTKSYRQKMAYWKHERNGYNFFHAADICNQLNASSRTRKLGGFHVFTHASLDFDINEVMTWGYYDVDPPVPQQEIKIRCEQLIQQYIQKKLAFNYRQIATPIPRKRKILPILAQ